LEDGKTDVAVDGSETIKVPIVEERVEVTKKPGKTEEIVIGKRTVEDTEHISETVKKEEAHVRQKGTGKVDKRQTGNIKAAKPARKGEPF